MVLHCRRTTKVHRCLNLGSYNYLGFAAADEYCTPRVIESLKKFSSSTCSTRVDGGNTFPCWNFTRLMHFIMAAGLLLMIVTTNNSEILSRYNNIARWVGGVCSGFCRKTCCHSFWHGIRHKFGHSSCSNWEGMRILNPLFHACYRPWLNSLLQGGLIISDSLNHNSIVNGARGSGATVRVFQHNSKLK